MMSENKVLIKNGVIYVNGRKTKFDCSQLASVVTHRDGVFINGRIVTEEDYFLGEEVDDE